MLNFNYTFIMIRLFLFSKRFLAPAVFMLIIGMVTFVRPVTAVAHPHVWVVARTSLIFDDAGNLSGLRHEWVFDKPYSAYITTGLDTDRDGKLSEQELAGLAKENTEALLDFGYFTKLKIGGVAQDFSAPRNYKMSVSDGNLIQYFDLPLKKPVKAPKIIGLEVYDETYFVAFSLAETKDAVTLSGSLTSECSITISRPKQINMDELSKLSEDYFANAGMGMQYANKAVVACP